MNDRNPGVRDMRRGWLVALLPTAVAGVVYVHSMPPTVTMSSGAFVTASFGFGVPITPGYPLWTLAGFLWSHFILPVGDTAWRLAMMSVTASAATVGVMALTMMRSTTMLLHALPWSEEGDGKQESWIATLVGVSTALMFGFDRTVWQWACVPEPQALYTLLYFLAVAFFLAWLRKPHQHRSLYATVLCISLTVATADLNAWQVTAVMALPFFVAVVAQGIDRFRVVRRRGTEAGHRADAERDDAKCESGRREG